VQLAAPEHEETVMMRGGYLHPPFILLLDNEKEGWRLQVPVTS
jgi:hypothetical protein